MVRNKKECTYEFPIGCEVLIVKVAREKRIIETDRVLEVVIKETGIVYRLAYTSGDFLAEDLIRIPGWLKKPPEKEIETEEEA